MPSRILTCHLVPGKMNSRDLAKAMKAGGGRAELKTVEGDSITIGKKHHE